MSFAIERASTADVASVLAVLAEHGLPAEGAADILDTMLVARDGVHVVGVAALDVYADGALLRSVAVAATHQGRGLGRELTKAALALATTSDILNVYLLTTTAEGYFPRFGFHRITREAVPASVQASVEFQSACPASAVVMRRRIGEAA